MRLGTHTYQPVDEIKVRGELSEPTTGAERLDGVAARSNWQRQYTEKLRISDFVVVCAAVIMAQIVRFGPALTPSGYYLPAFSALFAIAWLSALAGFRTRSPRLIGTGLEEYRRVVAASFWTFGAIAMVALLLKLDIARGYLAVALPAGTLGLVLSRWTWHRYIASKRARGECQTAVLAFGEREAVTNLINELTRERSDGYQVVGVGIPGYGLPTGEHLTVNDRAIPVVGGEADMLEAIRSCGADTVAIAGTEHFGVRGIRRLIWDLEPMGVDLVVSTGVMDCALSRLVMRPTAGLPLLHIEKPLYQGAKRFQKRAFDFCFALFALTVTSPLLLLAGMSGELTRPPGHGPVSRWPAPSVRERRRRAPAQGRDAPARALLETPGAEHGRRGAAELGPHGAEVDPGAAVAAAQQLRLPGQARPGDREAGDGPPHRAVPRRAHRSGQRTAHPRGRVIPDRGGVQVAAHGVRDADLAGHGHRGRGKEPRRG